MNDDFLYDLRPDVPAGLAESIKQRIAERADGYESADIALNRVQVLSGWLTTHRAFAIIIAVALLTGCIGALRSIGVYFFEETSEYPYATQVPVIQKMVTREEILPELNFTVNFPTWVLTGYELLDEAMVTLPSDDSALSQAWQIWLYWENDDVELNPRRIVLLAYPAKYERGFPVPVGPDALEETEVNGHPAVIIHGSWVESRQEWDENIGKSIRWVQGDTSYWLQSAWVSIEELIRIAESIP